MICYHYPIIDSIDPFL